MDHWTIGLSVFRHTIFRKYGAGRGIKIPVVRRARNALEVLETNILKL